MAMSTKQWVVDDISEAALFELGTEDPVGFFDRLNKITVGIAANQQRVYGGTSKYAFHLSEQDAESNVQLENALMDFNQLLAATGATLSAGSTVVPMVEKLAVTGTTATLSKGASLVASSEKVIVASKDHVNAGVQLSRVASAPTALQYSITAAGVITFGDATLTGKDVRVFYNYTATNASVASVKTTTKNKAYKFVAYGKAIDDETNTPFNCIIIIYKAQMLGTFTIDQQRKSATANTLDLAILDPNRADGKVIDIIAV